jgi:hypothetical protein
MRSRPALSLCHPIPKPTSEVNHEELSSSRETPQQRKELHMKHEDDHQEDNHMKTWSNP